MKKKYIAMEPNWIGFRERDEVSGSTVEEALGKFQRRYNRNPLFVLTEEEYDRAVDRLGKVYTKMIRHPKMYPKNKYRF